MKRRWKRWKKYLLYAGVIIIGGSLLIILEETIRRKNTGFETKTLWDWMELLIIPLFLAGGAFYLNRSERNTDREIAADRQKEEALQTYLNHMADLLLKDNLRASENEAVHNVARIRTQTVLRGLDATRKGIVVRFLYEAGLLGKEKRIVDMTGADLDGANLTNADLKGANLQDVSLEGARLILADLQDANLKGAKLKNAILVGAKLKGANLQSARLEGANLGSVRLQSADLQGANLNSADLNSANLTNANLTAANLKGANLRGAIMPDGTKHE